MESTRIAAMLRVGGSEWQRGTMHRIYFNNLPGWYGLETERYQSGNISSAQLNGEKVSNSEARAICERLALGKVYYDFADDRYHGQGVPSDDFQVITRAIKRAVKAEMSQGVINA